MNDTPFPVHLWQEDRYHVAKVPVNTQHQLHPHIRYSQAPAGPRPK